MKQMQQELRALGAALSDVRHEQERDRAVAERDREVLMLRLENALLKLGHALPAPPDQP